MNETKFIYFVSNNINLFNKIKQILAMQFIIFLLFKLLSC